MANYSYVIDSTFRPFSFSEMMAPISMYKDAYEKTEEAYNTLMKDANTFEYLKNELPEDSKARGIYEKYVNDLRQQAQDLSHNGLNVMNRSALTGLRNRYHGEIGLLNKYQTELDELTKGRNALQAKGIQMLYGDDNPNIDSLMSGQFNRYSIDSNELYKRGALAGKAASSKEYNAGDAGSTLNGMYRVWKEQRGIQDVDGFLNTEAAQRGIDDILIGTGAMEHLSGKNLERARQEIINGIRDGIMYEESSKPVRDAAVPSWSERRADERATRAQAISEAMNGITWEDGKPVYSKDNDLQLQRQLQQIQERAKYKTSGSGISGSSSGSSRGGSGYGTINEQGIRINWKGNNPDNLNGDADDDIELSPLDKDEQYVGAPKDYDDLPQYMKDKVDKIVGNRGSVDDYIYYYRPYESGYFNDTESALDIVPRKVQRGAGEEESDDDFLYDSK